MSDECFYGCEGLNGNLYLPSSICSLGYYPFRGTKFRTVHSLNTTPPIYSSSSFPDVSVFDKDNLQATLYVPDSSVEAYKASDVWKDFFKILPMSGLGDSAIDGVTADDISVTVVDGNIVITAQESALTEVFNLAGVKLRSTTDRRISDLNHGFHIVRVAGKVFKVSI